METTPWIIDSEATDHVCNSLKLFTSYRAIAPIFVRLPNGTTATVTYVGTVRLNKHFVIHDMLYIPQFNLNLISVPRLLEYGFDVHFSGILCIIQDPSQKQIGLGRVQGRLVHLLDDDIAATICSVSSNSAPGIILPASAIWHYRFGHASHSKVEMLCKDFPSIVVNKDLVCDICHLARQRKLPFTLSTSRASTAFDLLHLDV